jgi:cell filamentation protein
MSRYDAVDDYVYPGTQVLRNKAEIREQAALDAFEADATAVRMLELLERPIPGGFDFAHLCAMHQHLFQDVYEWAGEIRTVDISRDTSRFANASRIDSYLSGELRKLSAENWLRGLPPDAVVARLAHYMGEINATHPFREGNGRTQRVFCSLLAEQAGYFIDFESVDQAQMYRVMIASFNGDAKPLEALLLNITSIIDEEQANAEGMTDD